MMKFLRLITLIIFVPTVLQSQISTYSIEEIAFQSPINNFDTTFAWYCDISVQDTTNISLIQLNMGTYNGGLDIVSHEFVFDKDAFLPSGLSYRREGNNLRLGLGNYKMNTYFIEIYMEFLDSTNSQSYLWNNKTLHEIH